MATPKHTTRQDWHPADIKAALAKKGYTFARIASEYGYVTNTPCAVLRKPWSQIEEIVARILGVPAARIWPSRYNRLGQPLKSRTARVRTKTTGRRITKQDTVSND